MLAVGLNGISVAIGGIIGLCFKNLISDKHINSIFSIIGVVILVMGLQGIIPSDHMIVIVISMFLGSIIGVSLDLSGKLKRLSDKYQNTGVDAGFVSGAISIFLIQCMGAMAIIGPMKAGLDGDYSLLYFKAILDMCSGIIFASMYGKSIFLSALLLVLYQGGIFLIAGFLGPVLSPALIEQISQVGSVLLIALSLDMLDIKKFQLVNYLPALLMPALYNFIINFF